MANLGSLYYTMFLKDMTNEGLQKINAKLKNLGFDITLTPKILKELTQSAVPKGVKIELDPSIKNEALQKIAEGKTMKVAVTPLLTGFREAIIKATRENPPLAEIGVQETKLRSIIQNVLNKQGFMLNVSTVNDNYSKAIQQKLNGRKYTVTIHANANEIARSVQASLMQVQSRYFGLQVSKDILRNSINEALMGKPFNIHIAVQQDQARKAVQDALLRAQVMGKDQALAYQRLQTGELRAAQTELAKLRAEQLGAAKAANTHASASVNLGGALGSNIKIAGELGAAMASLYSVHAAKQFLSQVIEIGGELEHQKIALETIYGTPSKMESLYGQIKSLARQSPFGVMELTKNVKQLSAYGVAYNEVYDTAKRLADISAATSVDIQRLILAFGKTKNRTFLDGLEAKQFAYANIPIYDALSKKLTELEGKFVSVKDVMGRIKKREIGFDMVKDILWDMTDEGGKFYNMQEKLAGSVKTSWKLVRDNIELMFGEIAEGKVGEGLKSVAELLQGLTRNWKTLGSVIGAGAIAFGIYKTAVLAHNVVAGQSLTIAAKQHASLKMARYHANLAAQSYRTLTQAEEENYLASSGLAKIKGINVLWSKKLNAAEAGALLNKKLLTKEDMLRLVALKKVTSATAEAVLITKGMEAADIAETKAQIARAAAAKKSVIVWKQIKAGLAGVVSSLWSFTKMAFPMAAIGAGIAIWQKHSEQAERAKEFGDSMFTRAVDEGKELREVIKGIGNDIQNLDGIALQKAFETLSNAIKDYAPNPDKILTDAKFDSQGNRQGLREQVSYLDEYVKKMEQAAALAEKIQINTIIENAANANSGWFDDDWKTDIKDLGEQYIAQMGYITQFAQKYPEKMREIVDAAVKVDKSFAQNTKGMNTYEEKFKHLAVNITKYSDAMNAVYQEHSQQSGKRAQDTLFERFMDQGRLKKDKEEALKESREFFKAIMVGLKEAGIDTSSEAGKNLLEFASKSIFDEFKSLAPELQDELRNLFNEVTGLEFDDSYLRQQVSNKLLSLINESEGELARKIKRGDKLGEAEQELLEKLKKQAIDEVGKNLPDDLKQKLDSFTADNTWWLKILVNFEPEQIIEEWQKSMIETFGENPEITAVIKSATDPVSALKAIAELQTTAQTALNQNALILNIKPQLSNPQKLNLNDYSDPVQRQAAEAWNKQVEVLSSISGQNKYNVSAFGKESKSPKPKDSKGSQKDPFADAIKERIKILKEAKKEYEDLAKSIGTEAAFNELKDSPIFAGLKANQHLSEQAIPRNLEEYKKALNELQEKLTAKGLKTQKHRELNIEIEKVKFEIKKKETEDALKLTLDKVSKEAERQIADWNLFNKIRKATGNQDLAMSIAFGMNATAETDYPKMIEAQFDKQAKAYEDALAKKTKGTKNEYSLKGYTYISLQSLYNKAQSPDATDADIQAWMDVPEEIRKAWEKAYSENQKYRDKESEEVADMVAQYRNTQEEIIAITAEAEEKKRKIRENKDLSPVQKQQITDRIDADLNYQVFQKSGEYLKFFNAILSMTGKEAEDVGRKIKEALDAKLQAGAISAKDYCEEMEKIDKQLEKIRQKQKGFGGFGSFVKGGLSQMFKDRFEQADSDYNKASQDFDTAKQQFDLFSKEGNEAGMQQAQSAMDGANAMMKGAKAAMNGAQGAMQTVAMIDTIVHGINDTVQGIHDAFGQISDMADSFGVDTSADTGWGAAGAFLDAFSQASEGATKAWDSLKSGNIGGVISGVVQSITSWFTVFNKWHDAKLQKQIERSQEIVDNIQYAYDAIERRMANFLGNPKYSGAFGNADPNSGGAYGAQRDLMQQQLEELEKQRQAELDKKKSDDSVVKDYEDQIDELTVKIHEFAIEVAKDLYGIDLKDWASQLGDALFDAWQKGEDGAEAFKKKAGEILGDVMNNILKIGLLEPMMQDVSDYLFGTEEERKANGGKGGVFGTDFELTPDEVSGLAEKLMKGMEGVDAYNSALDELEKVLNEKYGLSMKGDGDTTGNMTKGLQSLTENTGDLLASYVNGIRGDTSVMRLNWDKLMESTLPQMNIIAEAQLTAQRQIAENTLRTAEAAEAINTAMDLVTRNQDRLERSWRRIAEKNWGTS